MFLLFCTLYLFSCTNNEPTPAQNPNKPQNQLQIDSTIALLKTGDVVLRRGKGPDSYMLAQLNLKEKTYSHCGIVVVENGYPFVYHSIGGEDNPDERLRRDSASFFFSQTNNKNIAVVRYTVDTVCLKSMVSYVLKYYKISPRFDMEFRLETDDKLYCSEFVYKVISNATQDTGFIKLSYGHERRFVGIDDLYMNEHAAFVRKVNFK